MVDLPIPRAAACLVVARRPLPVPSADGVEPDVFCFVFGRPEDAAGRLQLLTRVARLTRSQPLLGGLRRARTAEQALALIRSEEAGRPGAADPGDPHTSRALVVAAVSGERAVDAFLVRLVALGLDDAMVLEAQSVGEATTREVPLFAGFRGIFGDPGGRRVVLAEIGTEQVRPVVAALRKSCEEHDVRDAWLCAVPLLDTWRLESAAEEVTAERH